MIARAVPIIIDKTEVCLDFHIYAILEFELLIVYPFEKLFQEKPSHGSLDEKFGKTASIISIPYPKNPKAKEQPNHNPFEKVKFISPFISPKLAYETEQSSSRSLEPKLCPSGHQNVLLDSGRDSMMFLHVISLENENFYAMDMLLSTPCPYEEHNHPSLLVSKLFRRMVVNAFIYHKIYNSCSATVALIL